MKLKHVWWKRLGARATVLFVFVSGSVGALAATLGAPPQTNAVPAEADIPKSVFVDDARSGRDPFFPNSTRRNLRPATRTPQLSAGPVTPPQVQLVLRAVLVGQSKRLAQINNRNFEVGEEAEVLAGNQKIKIRCLEIRESSVLVRIEGVEEPRELSLRKR